MFFITVKRKLKLEALYLKIIKSKNLWTHTEEELFGTSVKCLIISHALSPGRMRLTHVKAGAKESLCYISAPRWSILHAGMYIYYLFFFYFGRMELC